MHFTANIQICTMNIWETCLRLLLQIFAVFFFGKDTNRQREQITLKPLAWYMIHTTVVSDHFSPQLLCSSIFNSCERFCLEWIMVKSLRFIFDLWIRQCQWSFTLSIYDCITTYSGWISDFWSGILTTNSQAGLPITEFSLEYFAWHRIVAVDMVDGGSVVTNQFRKYSLTFSFVGWFYEITL